KPAKRKGAQAPIAFTDPLVSEALAGGRFSDPFAVLGAHDGPGGRIVRAFLPGASGVEVVSRKGGRYLGVLAPEGAHGLFSGSVSSDEPYLLRIDWHG